VRIAMPAAVVAAALGLAAPAQAQVVCRSNVLGAEVCTGLPAPTLRGCEPYRAKRRGLGRVQAPVRAETGPGFAPARATDALGNTFLTERELPPRRAPLAGVAPVRDCRRDALGNLLCD
jgi:hypothetical protein